MHGDGGRRWSRRSLLGAAAAGVGARFVAVGPAAARQVTRPWPTEGWETTTPEAANIDPAALLDVEARIPTETPDLSAMLVARGGRLVWERSFNGYRPGTPLNTRSVTKSVTGTLVGIARREGILESLEATVGQIIPDRIPAGADPLVRDVTVWQLLTMTSGLAWDASADWPTLTSAPDWVALTLGLPVTGLPGQTFAYNTGGSHVLGVTVAAVAGEPLEEYARSRLFEPLGIAPGCWTRSPQGEVSAGSGLELSARDMAKLGYLYLNAGEWDGGALLTPDYAAAATTWQSAGDATGGWAGYGYQWWITQTNAGYPAYFALGYGGQHIFVVPALDLIVVAAVARRVPSGELRTPRYLIETIAAGAY